MPRFVALLCAFGLMFVLTGCGSDDSDSETNTTTAGSTAAVDGATAATAATGSSKAAGGAGSATAKASVGTAVKALVTAAKTVGGQALKIENQGRAGWEIEVAVDGRVRELKISADGKTVNSNKDDGAVDREDQRRLVSVKTTLAAAIKTAATKVGGTLQEGELGRRRTKVVWEIKLSEGAAAHEVYVDAANGRVVKVEQDD
jgi:uncharacterized membrane protein YkoI